MKVSEHLQTLNASQELINSVPTNCPKCNSDLEIINDLHLTCINNECVGKLYSLFAENFNRLDIVGASGATAQKLWDAGFSSPFDVLNPDLFNEESLIQTGEFKKGRSLEILLAEAEKIKSLSLQKIILAMGIPDLGRTISKMLAKYYAKQDYDFSGLTKLPVAEFMKRKHELEDIINDLTSWGIEIIYPEEISQDAIKFEMTGSPKSFGFNAKKDFIDYAKSKGYVHSKISEATVLITDDMNGSSSKMKKALKDGLTIKLYSEL